MHSAGVGGSILFSRFFTHAGFCQFLKLAVANIIVISGRYYCE